MTELSRDIDLTCALPTAMVALLRFRRHVAEISALNL